MRVSAKWLSIRLVQVIFNFPEFVSKCCTYNVASACPLFGSHNLMGCWLSLLPDTISAFCGCQCTHFTSAPWPLLLIFIFKVKIRIQINTIVRHSALIKHLPLSTRSSWQRKKSQTRSVPSSLHVTNLLSDGLKLWKFQLNIYFSKSSSSFLFILFIYSCYCSFIPCHPKIPSIFNLYLLIHSEYPQSFIDSNITIMILFGKTRKNKTALIPLVDFPRDVYHFIDFFFWVEHECDWTNRNRCLNITLQSISISFNMHLLFFISNIIWFQKMIN